MSPAERRPVNKRDRKRIAILPLMNLSPDPQDEYFADGLTEELITTVSRMRDLRVIARTSVMRFKKENVGVAEIARELDVGTVLEGSVRKGQNKLRVTVQLVDAQNEEHLWVQSYDRDVKDVLEIQSDIAKRVAAALKVQLAAVDKRAPQGTAEGADAYSLYLKGRYHYHKSTSRAEDLQQAIAYFEQAIEREPDYALPYAALSSVYAGQAFAGSLPSKDASSKAKQYALRAIALDDTLAEAHTSLAKVLHFEWNLSGAEAEIKRAIEVNPSYAQAYWRYAHLLMNQLRIDEAVSQEKHALELDPLSPQVNYEVGTTLYYARRFDEAVPYFRKALDFDVNHAWAHHNLGMTLVQMGVCDQGMEELQRSASLRGFVSPLLKVDLAYAYVHCGNSMAAREVLREAEKISNLEAAAAHIAALHSILGEKETAFEWLEKAYRERSALLTELKSEFWFENIRSDPRFASLTKRVGLEKGAMGDELREAAEFIAQLEKVDLSDFGVIGGYRRFDEKVRNSLKDLRLRIAHSLSPSSRQSENYLIWGLPGTGKTYFARQLADSLGTSVLYREMNLTELDESAFRSKIAEVASTDMPCLCFVDEIDARPGDSWPFETLLTALEPSHSGARPCTFILAGSSASSLTGMKERIAERPKGSDLLSRVPHENEFEIPRLNNGDKVIIALQQLTNASRDRNHELKEIEKLALLYVLVSPHLVTARELREFSVRCIERLPPDEDRIKYDHLFQPGDPENKEFWLSAKSKYRDLAGTFTPFRE